MMHLEELRRRSIDDWRFESRSWLLATVGLISAGVWLARSRQWRSWATALVAGFLQLAWLTIFSTW